MESLDQFPTEHMDGKLDRDGNRIENPSLEGKGPSDLELYEMRKAAAYNYFLNAGDLDTFYYYWDPYNAPCRERTRD